jgi:hypothetical protein
MIFFMGRTKGPGLGFCGGMDGSWDGEKDGAENRHRNCVEFHWEYTFEKLRLIYHKIQDPTLFD